jgi:hypothetical protein
MSPSSLERQTVRFVYVTPVTHVAGGALGMRHTRHSLRAFGGITTQFDCA